MNVTRRPLVIFIIRLFAFDPMGEPLDAGELELVLGLP